MLLNISYRRSIIRSTFVLIVTVVSYSASCQSYFKENAQAMGISHHHVSPDLFGAGVAVFDYDNDGFEDIYLTGGTLQDVLYRNNQGISFEDITRNVGLGVTSIYHTTAVTYGDINNDGLTDLFVCTQRGYPNQLFLNRSDGTFRNISISSGVSDSIWSTGALMADFNNDTFLDIYVLNYIKEPALLRDANDSIIGYDHTCYPNKLFINNGDLTFTERSAEFQLDNEGCSLSGAALDENADGLTDLLIVNDFGAWVEPNSLMQNSIDYLFVDIAPDLRLNDSIYGMGVALSDLNGDAKSDFYMTNIGDNVLRFSTADEYEEGAREAGIGNGMAGDKNTTSWGPLFLDVDNDGDEDLYVANGYIPSVPFNPTSVLDPNKLFINLGNNSFLDISANQAMDFEEKSRGVAQIDFNNDGRLDLVVGNIETVVNTELNTLLYENVNDNELGWVKFLLQGTQSNRDGIGANIVLYAAGTRVLKTRVGGGSYASASSGIVHFGLNRTARVDSLSIRWPSGMRDSYLTLERNKTYLLKEGEGVFELGCNDPEASNYLGTSPVNYGCLYDDITGLNLFSSEVLTVYPNPATDNITLTNYATVAMPIDLIDARGSILRQFFTGSGLHQIDISDLSPGLYFLREGSGKAVRFIKN